MSESFIIELDKLYIRYGYEPRKNKDTRVYLFTKSIYNGADIVKTGTDEEAEELKKQYADAGYAVKIRSYKNIEDAENFLFKDFFISPLTSIVGCSNPSNSMILFIK